MKTQKHTHAHRFHGFPDFILDRIRDRAPFGGMAGLHMGRFALMMLVLATRLAVVAMLLYAGTLYLVHTISLSDLVLNAVLLDLVQDF